VTPAPVPISVVVCTMNRPEALARCLHALLAADPPPAEVVVVDQGSQPLEEALRARVEYVPMEDRGVSRARNHGAAAAQHDLLAFTDDDCVPAPGWIGAIAAAYDEGGDGVTGRVLPLPGHATGVAVSSRTSAHRRTFSGPGQVPWDIGTGGNLSLHRRALDAVGGFDEALGPGTRGRAAEDVDLLYRVVAAGFAIRYEPRAVVYHELKSRRTRVGGRFGYGFGLGTFLVRHAAAGDVHAAALRRRYVRAVGRRMATGLRHGTLWPAAEGALTLAGILAASVARDRP
jgi:GT2 family glycosyltransferase